MALVNFNGDDTAKQQLGELQAQTGELQGIRSDLANVGVEAADLLPEPRVSSLTSECLRSGGYGPPVPTGPPACGPPAVRRDGCLTAVSRTGPAKGDSHIHRSATIHFRVDKVVAAVAGGVPRSTAMPTQHRPRSRRLA